MILGGVFISHYFLNLLQDIHIFRVLWPYWPICISYNISLGLLAALKMSVIERLQWHLGQKAKGKNDAVELTNPERVDRHGGGDQGPGEQGGVNSSFQGAGK